MPVIATIRLVQHKHKYILCTQITMMILYNAKIKKSWDWDNATPRFSMLISIPPIYPGE